MLKKLFITILLLCSVPAFGYWQIAGSPVRTPGKQPDKLIYKNYPKRFHVNPAYTMTTQKGLLYNNVKSYAKQHGWRVRWYAKRDYPLVRNAKIMGPSFKYVLSQLLSNYPRIKATYNQHRQIVVIGLRMKR